MSEYIVSARKYRPQTFDTVVGQEHITTTLKNAIRNEHLAHAYLFCGPRGVGKTTCARILAKTINCQSPTPDMEACGVCPMCQSFKNNTTFNIFELDAASNNSVDDIRELTSQVRFAPQQGKYKVYIIDEVHMLSAAAFNAFLKTLEEPPPYAIFILATTEKHKILPTILSRCQIFDFKRITTGDIVTHLQNIAGKEGMTAQEAALHVIALKSEGCMRDALSMLDRIASFTNGMLSYVNTMEHLNLLDADFYFSLTDILLCCDVPGALLQFDAALEKGFEGDTIISGLAEHFRNLLLCRDPRMVRLLDVPKEFKNIFLEKANQAPPSFILSALNIINACELEYKNATNKRLHVEMCLIRLCYLQKVVSGAQIASADVKKNFSNEPDAVKPAIATVGEAVITNTMHQQSGGGMIVSEPKQSTVETTAPQPHNYGSVASVEPIKPKPATQPASPNKKLHSGLLDGLDQAMSSATQARGNQQKELSETRANEIFEKYKQQILAEGKNMLHAQFSSMRIEVLPPANASESHEVHIVSTSAFLDTYAQQQRSTLIDFFYKEAGFPVRVTTGIREDITTQTSQTPAVLSKLEIYELMARNNPNLARLKDALGLQIEY